MREIVRFGQRKSAAKLPPSDRVMTSSDTLSLESLMSTLTMSLNNLSKLNISQLNKNFHSLGSHKSSDPTLYNLLMS